MAVGLFAQQPTTTEKKNTVTIKMTKEIDGVKTVIDTTVTSDSDIDVEALMEAVGVDADVHESHDGDSHTIQIKVDTDGESGAHNVFKFKHNADGEISMEGLDAEMQAKVEAAMEKAKELHLKFQGENGEVFEMDGNQHFEWHSDDGENHFNIKLDGLGEQIEGEIKKAFESIEMEELDPETRAKLEEMGIEVKEGANMFQFKTDDGENVFIHKHAGDDADVEQEVTKEMQVSVTVDAEDDGKKVVKKMIRIAVFVEVEDLSTDDEELLRDSGIEVGDVKNSLAVNELSFYPNPSNGRFNLSFEAAEAGDVNISVLNAQGQKIYGEKLVDFSGPYEKEIDLTGEASGVYFLNISQNGKVMNKKLVVN